MKGREDKWREVKNEGRHMQGERNKVRGRDGRGEKLDDRKGTE